MLSSLGAPPPKWKRINPSKIDYRAPGGCWLVLADGDRAFQFRGASYRQTKITFAEPIKRFIVKFSVLGASTVYPQSADLWGDFGSFTGWHKDADKVFVHTSSITKKGAAIIGSAAPGDVTWMEILDVYGEVLK
jgi:hypothetical protein